MRRALAIAAVTARGAVRSRVLLSLLAVLTLIVAGLPHAIKGDGTAAGTVQVLIDYTLSASMFILSLAIVWAGCSAVSLEVRDRQIHLIAVKPVRALELWFGKWLGLAALLGIVTAMTGAAVYGKVRWAARSAAVPIEERAGLEGTIFASRRAFVPRIPDLEPDIADRIRLLREEGRIPADARGDVEAAVRREVRAATLAVRSGGRRSFAFDAPGADPAYPAHLEFRMIKSILDLEPVAGRWTLSAPDGATRWESAGAWSPQRMHSVSIPGAAMEGLSSFTLTFENRDEAGAAVFFDPDGGLRLLVRRGGFGWNFVRALLVLWAQASLLAAVGLTAGALLSMPVASFCSLSLVVATRMAGGMSGVALSPSAEESAMPAALGLLRDAYYAALDRALAPLRGGDELRRLASGLEVGWGEVARRFALDLVVGCGALALIGAWLFRRRELGLAGRGE